MVAILFTYLLSLVVFSCSSIDCPVQNTVSVQYEIRDKAGASLAITDSLSVISTRRDGKDILLNFTTRVDDQKIILNKLVGESAFSLPISYSHPEDVLFFCFTDSVKTVVDTVWIKKDDIPHFESVDCSASKDFYQCQHENMVQLSHSGCALQGRRYDWPYHSLILLLETTHREG